MEINILYITILVNIITTYLIIISKSNDKYLLLFGLVGQYILIYGDLYKNDFMIRISHVFFTLVVVIGSFCICEKNNLLLIILLIISRFLSYIIFDGCLFNIMSNNHILNIEKITKIHDYVNWHYVYTILLIMSVYRFKYILK